MIDVDKADTRTGCVGGVRCFDSGVGSGSEIASGKDESQNIRGQQMRTNEHRAEKTPHTEALIGR